MYKPPRCGDCEYWRKANIKTGTYKPNDAKGECRVNPPQMGPNGYGYWPLTAETDFCYAGKIKIIQPEPEQLNG